MTPDGYESIIAGELYRSCLHASTPPMCGWFGVCDCFARFWLTILLFYWSLFTSPWDFAVYSAHYNHLCYGPAGLLLTLTLPVAPLAIVILEVINKLRSGSDGRATGPKRVFLIGPDDALAGVLWSCYLNTSTYVGLFLLAGTHPEALSHMMAGRCPSAPRAGFVGGQPAADADLPWVGCGGHRNPGWR